MAAFSARDPKIEEVVGTYGDSVRGVVVLAAGTATVDLSAKMIRIDGVVTGNSTAGSTTVTTAIVGTGATALQITIAGGTTDVISYIAFGLAKR